jgi:adenosylcobinamide-phosphate synthase
MLLDSPARALAILLVALAGDALLGDPPWLYRRLPHPVVLLGRAITRLEQWLLEPGASDRRKTFAGAALVAAVAGGAAGAGLAARLLLAPLPSGWLAEAALVGTLLAQRSLVEHVGAVADGLDRGLAEGRAAVARIVGRDPERLDRAGVGRAAVESLAENFSDGVAAPLFWAALAGLPGILAYKAVNTLDSMVGHKSERYRAFGRASARLDDLVNLVPARLSGVLVCLAGWAREGVPPWRSLRAMARGAGRHRSPNAGWPEAAMAAVLGVRLAGPRVYGGRLVEDAWMGDGRAAVTPSDIRRGIGVAWAAWWLATGGVALALLLVLVKP